MRSHLEIVSLNPYDPGANREKMIHAVSVGGPYAVSPVNHSSLELMYVEEGRQSLACFSCNMFKRDGGTGDKFGENMVKKKKISTPSLRNLN